MNIQILYEESEPRTIYNCKFSSYDDIFAFLEQILEEEDVVDILINGDSVGEFCEIEQIFEIDYGNLDRFVS